CAVEHAARDFDAVRALLIQAAPAAQVEEAGFETPLLLRQGAAAGGQLKIMDAEFVDGGRALVEQLCDRPRGRDGVVRGGRTKAVGIRVHPDASDPLLL